MEIASYQQKTIWDKCVDVFPIVIIIISCLYFGVYYFSNIGIRKSAIIEELIGTFYFVGIAVVLYFGEIFLRKQNHKPLESGLFIKFYLRMLLPLIVISACALLMNAYNYGKNDGWFFIFAIFFGIILIISTQIYVGFRIFIFKKFELKES